MYDKSANATIFSGSMYSQLVASDTLIAFADAGHAVSEASYTKKKEIVMQASGTYRIKFTTSAGTGITTYGRIYRNDAAVGTEQVNNFGSQDYTEDISGWSVGDKLQIYCKATSGSGTVSYLKIYGSTIIYTVNLD
jgi:hypothetical protein